jgi:hypothetical protein
MNRAPSYAQALKHVYDPYKIDFVFQNFQPTDDRLLSYMGMAKFVELSWNISRASYK